MATYGLPILFTLALWWVSTFVILYLDGLHRRTFVWSLTGATLLMGLALVGVLANLTLPAWDPMLMSLGVYRPFSARNLLTSWRI